MLVGIYRDNGEESRIVEDFSGPECDGVGLTETRRQRGVEVGILGKLTARVITVGEAIYSI